MSIDWRSPEDRRALTPRNMRVRNSAVGQVPQAEVVVGVAMRNQAGSLARCLRSIWDQELPGYRLAVVLLNDRSEDDWEAAGGELLRDPRLLVVDANCGTAARARNAILDFVDAAMPAARWVARLDADDRFSCTTSLLASTDLAARTGARFVLGGNRLCRDGVLLDRVNPATKDLLIAASVVSRLREMAEGTAVNELPSCNLLLAAGSGWRYPDAESAEDHWLVAHLLIHHAQEGAVLDSPLYCDYSLHGPATRTNHANGQHLGSRKRLFEAASAWARARSGPGVVLGAGREGIVRRIGDWVEKRFYPGRISDEHVAWLRGALRGVWPHLPEPSWEKEGASWCLRYPWVETGPVSSVGPEAAGDFLRACLGAGLVCANIKRSNFRQRHDGGLMFIDLGPGVIPLNVDYFLDSAARLYATTVLGWDDDELRRRNQGSDTQETLASIPGFGNFYREMVSSYARRQWSKAVLPSEPEPAVICDDATLLIKACAMDAAALRDQVRHIVSQLERPRRFRERMLLLDPHRGPFLRQHCPGDFDLLTAEASRLREEGTIDRILTAPEDTETVSAVHERWFGLPCTETHSIRGIPVAPQLWGFEQVGTRFVLQCDVDVLVGRRDLAHDYLGEMLRALEREDVVGIGFNIPHAPDSVAKPYEAPLGQFVPEVRCGLLDLERIRRQLPLPNDLEGGRLTLTWYRSLQAHQERRGLRTLRGGDPRTFYVHPPNEWKRDPALLSRIRDLVAQGRVPAVQFDQWDLVGTEGDWRYPSRREDIVFLAKGRDTPRERVRRCFQSLAIQDDQDFGVVVVDDASTVQDPSLLPHLLGPLAQRTTLIRRETRRGRLANMRFVIGEVCTSPDSLVVILDLDDALMDPSVVRRLRGAMQEGCDVVLGAMFRPDKPIKSYHPGFDAPRARWGDDVWIHLRSFRKKLFDLLPDDALRLDGSWIEHCTDYATMIPIVELCSHPRFIPEYLYFHERSTPRTPELRALKDRIIRRILEKEPIRTRFVP
jgi:glycosyltransferase involved in cell wall biosynthesis